MEVMPIPCPHFKITIVKRSQGQSAVAGAAYQSGERLFSEYDQKTKFYNKKKELVHAEIMLPSHAPPGYADRATLWNAVEAVENQWNSQLARRIVLAFPVEVPKDQYLPMLKEFCQEQFVSNGMIADFAIHDKGDGNPHAHILLTLRAMDEHGKWLPKARKVYDLDETGERIRLPSGNWKCHKENTVDWNDQKYAEVWRHTADEMLSGIEPQRETKTQQAKDLICTLLAGGKQVFSEDIDKAALERGIPGRTGRDAKRELGDALKSKIVEGRKKVFWME